MAQADVTRSGIILRSVLRLRVRYAMLFALIAISTAFAILGVFLGSYAGDSSSSSSQETRRLREITVYPGSRTITDTDLAAIQGLTGVEHVIPFVRVVVGMEAGGGASLSIVGVDGAAHPPNLVMGEFGSDHDTSWIVLPEKAGDNHLGHVLGQDIVLTATSAIDSETGQTREVPFRVVGISDPTYQVDAVDAAYVSLDAAKALYFARLGITPSELAEAGGYEKASVIASDQGSVAAVVEALQGQGFQAVSTIQELESVPGVIALIRLVVTLVTAGLVAMCVITSVMFAVSLVRQRSREFGILRAVGWTARRVQASWTAEMLLVSVAAALTGALVGIVGGNYLAERVRDAIAEGALGPPILDPLAAAAVVSALLVATSVAVVATVSFAARSDVASLMRGLS